MVNWTQLINKNKKSVVEFAIGQKSSSDFQSDFSGYPNPARRVIGQYGALYSRRLARKALRYRGLIN